MSNNTANEKFSAWVGDSSALVAYRRSIYGGSYWADSDGSSEIVYGCAMYPDGTIKELVDYGFEHSWITSPPGEPSGEWASAIWDINERSCSVESGNWVYDVYRAEIRYVAFPLPEEWDNTDPEFADQALDSVVDWDAGVRIDSADSFRPWCQANHKGRLWVLREDVYYQGDADNSEPCVVYGLDIDGYRD